MRIVQIAPRIGPGSGVAGVAWNLEREFRAFGHTVESFTYETARTKPARPWPRRRLPRALRHFRRMIWFATVGTVRARRYLAERPDAVSICHNDVMAGDVYVNHGVVGAAMRARGLGLWRMLRNPTHPFTYVRDLIRYRSHVHRAVVALSPAEADTLREIYGRVAPPITVIPNGVDLERFHVPTPAEREEARALFQLDDEARVALFVGHEFSRKGLDIAIEALVQAPTVLLMVLGGKAEEIDASRAQAEKLGVTPRVFFAGPRFDLEKFFASADMLVLPSAYEANALVLLEALASGLPVLTTAVGYAPELIDDGVNGFLLPREPGVFAGRMEEVAAADAGAWSAPARASAEQHGWRATAEQYVTLLEHLPRSFARSNDSLRNL